MNEIKWLIKSQSVVDSTISANKSLPAGMRPPRVFVLKIVHFFSRLLFAARSAPLKLSSIQIATCYYVDK